MINKPYFTKYLPVEGEIKEGDKFHDSDYPTLGIQTARWDTKDKSQKKVKLFLCSRDIKVGDIVRHPKYGNCEATDTKGSGKYHFTDVHIGLRNEVVDFRELYKIIGEVSIDAVWVKEGMEFDEHEVDLRPVIYYQANGEKYARIKCPTCGSYH